jgi:hypothetical protein
MRRHRETHNSSNNRLISQEVFCQMTKLKWQNSKTQILGQYLNADHEAGQRFR